MLLECEGSPVFEKQVLVHDDDGDGDGSVVEIYKANLKLSATKPSLSHSLEVACASLITVRL